jgi:hypothetical protein
MDIMDWMFYGGVAVLVTALAILAGTGVFQGIPPVPSPLAFVFGQGRWIVWHVLLLGSLLAFSIGLLIAVILSADEVFIAFCILLASLAVLLVMTLVNSTIWGVFVRKHSICIVVLRCRRSSSTCQRRPNNGPSSCGG